MAVTDSPVTPLLTAPVLPAALPGWTLPRGRKPDEVAAAFAASIALKLPDDFVRSAPVLQALPHRARRSITFNRGTEFTDWLYLQVGIGSTIWFCDPQSPWQKGTVENTNGRARKWTFEGCRSPSITATAT